FITIQINIHYSVNLIWFDSYKKGKMKKLCSAGTLTLIILITQQAKAEHPAFTGETNVKPIDYHLKTLDMVSLLKDSFQQHNNHVMLKMDNQDNIKEASHFNRSGPSGVDNSVTISTTKNTPDFSGNNSYFNNYYNNYYNNFYNNQYNNNYNNNYNNHYNNDYNNYHNNNNNNNNGNNNNNNNNNDNYNKNFSATSDSHPAGNTHAASKNR
ncbi:hypothetical protein, partial [Erwinia sp. OLMDSP33]